MRQLPWLAVAVCLVARPRPSLRAQTDELLARARQERAAYLDTLRELVSIESGSRDVEGLERAATSWPTGSGPSVARWSW